MNRPHSSIASIVALERANEYGGDSNNNNKGQFQNCAFLENVSHGQLQALSTVPSDSSALDYNNEGSSSSYVISPPPILEGRGIVKRFWNRPLILPMHSGFHTLL